MQSRSLSSPIRRMPPEILGRIFDHTCETNLLQEFPWGPASDDVTPTTTMTAPALAYLPAMAIGSVCAQWRAIALSLPSLWSRILLEVSFHDVENVDNTVQSNTVLSGFLGAVELYLLRSGDHPLDLTLDVRGFAFTARNVSDPKLAPINLVGRHRSRWRSFRGFTQCSFIGLDQYLFDHPREFPVLENLELNDPAIIEYFKLAPRIHSLTMDGWDYDALELSPNQLTTLDIVLEDYGIDSALDQFPNLVEVHLREDEAYPRPFEPMPACVPPKRYDSITSLALILARTHNQVGQTALNSLTLPSLIDLRLGRGKYGPFSDPWSTRALIDFLRRSNPANLTTFSVKGVIVTDMSLIDALIFMPSLTSLTIDDSTVPSTESPITPDLISELRVSTSSSLHSTSTSNTVLLPKLQCLKLYFDGSSFDDAAFTDMVLSRWVPNAQSTSVIGISCLRTVVMSFRKRAVDEEVYRPFHVLDKAGMMVTVSSQGRVLVFE